MKPNRNRIENGLTFERKVAKKLDLKLIPGSGNKWYSQGDVAGHGLHVSCKATAKRTWKETRNQLNEAIDMARGTGNIPALAVEDDDGEELIILRLSNFAEAQAGGMTPIPPSVLLTKGEAKRAKASVPLLLRNRESE